ncbi:hypothetical protein H1C71_012156 [Ictidomys tridecemlineatus]|nr:hypothetical protein H1C71_012156 [Ictidomys tridecemlineatus]
MEGRSIQTEERLGVPGNLACPQRASPLPGLPSAGPPFSGRSPAHPTPGSNCQESVGSAVPSSSSPRSSAAALTGKLHGGPAIKATSQTRSFRLRRS